MEAPDSKSAQLGLLKRARGLAEQGDCLSPVGPLDSDKANSRPLPACLSDLQQAPPPWELVLGGPGRPPTDGLCLLRAFLGAVSMGLGDSPTAVHLLLHSNPSFARQCGFVGAGTPKSPGEWTSRALPSVSTCEEFDEVMTRYGLWHHVTNAQVQGNIDGGVVQLEDTLCADTTHLGANSACSSVLLDPDKPEGDRAKANKVRKRCDCGADQWSGCEHPWSATDPGAAVVVKGPTRVYWAHKASVVSLGGSDIPLSVAVLQYAATHDGKSLIPHLARMDDDLPGAIEAASFLLADPAYKGLHDGVQQRFALELIVGISGRKTPDAVTSRYPGIDRFTPSGVPVCIGEHRLDFAGRDIKEERYIWVAPHGPEGDPVCATCEHAQTCTRNGASRRNIRVPKEDFPQVRWERPLHQRRNRRLYAKRTGVERAIKRLKNDLGAQHLTRRGMQRVQAHLDRRLLVVHLLLSAAAD